MHSLSPGGHFWPPADRECMLNVQAIGNACRADGLSVGGLLALGATVCWGGENNCTARLAGCDPLQVVALAMMLLGAWLAALKGESA